MRRNIGLTAILAAMALLLAVSGCAPDSPTASPAATVVTLPSPAPTPTVLPSPVPTVAAPPTLAPTVTSGVASAEPEEPRNLCYVNRAFSLPSWRAPSSNGTIRWTPDGSLILFDYGEILPLDTVVYDPDLYAPIDTPDLYAVHVDGSRLDRIVNVPSTDSGLGAGVSETAFDLSPDGSRIVYAACALSYASTQGNDGARQVYNHEIFVSDFDGVNVARLTTNTHFDVLPSWSPDGERIAFLSDTGRRHGGRPRGPVIRLTIYTLATGESREVELSTASNVDLIRLEWSPDGESIAFVALERGDPWNAAAYVVAADGSGLSRVSDAASGPAWSPDGARIAIVVPQEEDALALYTFAADGSNPVEIEHDFSYDGYFRIGRWAGNLSWSPDGSAILFENLKDWGSGDWLRPLVVDMDRCPTAGAGTGGIDAGIPGLESLDVEARLVAVEAGQPLSDGLSLGHNASLNLSVEGIVVDIPQFATWSPDGSQIAVRNGGVWAPGFTEFELYVMDRSGNRSDLVMSVYTEEWQTPLVLVPDLSHSGSSSGIRPVTSDGGGRTTGLERCEE